MFPFRCLITGLVAALLLAVFSGMTAAQEARETEAKFITGLDGGLHEPRGPALVSKVREAPRAEGLYSGEVTGVLDEATMTALGESPKKNGLQVSGVSGVSSPETRKRLLKEA